MLIEYLAQNKCGTFAGSEFFKEHQDRKIQCFAALRTQLGIATGSGSHVQNRRDRTGAKAESPSSCTGVSMSEARRGSGFRQRSFPQ